jgi:hypothetical protein
MPRVQVKLIHIEGGRAVDMIDASIARVGREIIQNYNDNGDATTAKGSVTFKVDVGKHPDYDDTYEVNYTIAESYPKIKGKPSLADGDDGVLMANQRGTDRQSPKQESILDEPEFQKEEE